MVQMVQLDWKRFIGKRSEQLLETIFVTDLLWDFQVLSQKFFWLSFFFPDDVVTSSKDGRISDKSCKIVPRIVRSLSLTRRSDDRSCANELDWLALSVVGLPWARTFCSIWQSTILISRFVRSGLSDFAFIHIIVFCLLLCFEYLMSLTIIRSHIRFIATYISISFHHFRMKRFLHNYIFLSDFFNTYVIDKTDDCIYLNRRNILYYDINPYL